MTHNKKIFIKDIQDGQSVEDLFLIKEMSRAEARNGKPYLILTVTDRTGDLGGRLWDDADRWMNECQQGNYVLLKGSAQTYKGTLQLKVDSVNAVPNDEIDISLFLPSTTKNIPAMAEELISLAKSVDDPDLQELLLSIFKGDFFQSFQNAPAAKSMHHAYYGGLLEHTLAVTSLAGSVAAMYPVIDRSLLITGALLHDVGKVKEFSFDSYPFDYTDEGRLVGHLVLGAEMVQSHADNISGFPEELSYRLQHLILSHHGKHEFGSPVLPMMAEAFVLHFIDDMDAKLNYMGRLSEHVDESGYQWSEYQRNLERFLLLAGSKTLEHSTNTDIPPEDNRQQTLF